MPMIQKWTALMALYVGLCLLPVNANAASLLPNGKQQIVTSSGAPCANCSVGMYIPGTTIPKDTWQDADKSTLNTNPVILDTLGSAVIYGTGVYRQIVCPTSTNPCDGSELWDQITAAGHALNESWSGTSGGSANAQTLSNDEYAAVDGDLLYFIAGASNTGPMTLNVNSLGAVEVYRDGADGPGALAGGEVVAGNVIAVVYDSTLGVFHIVTPTPIQSFEGAVFFNGIITPTILSSDQDDWTPTGGFSGANTVRVSSNADITITGMTDGSAGRMVIMHNIGSFDVTFLSEAADSTAANRFTIPGGVQLVPGNTITFIYDGLTQRWRAMTFIGATPRGYIDGLTLSNNSSDANNDIDIAIGVARSDDDSTDMRLLSALTKRLDDSWSAGTNNGMLDTGAKASSTWYHVFTICCDPTTGLADILASTSVSSPSLPTGYTKKRRVGSIKTDGSSNIYGFIQTGNSFYWKDPNDHKFLSSASTSTSAANITVSDVPPGLEVTGLFAAAVDGDADSTVVYFYSTSATDGAPNLTNGYFTLVVLAGNSSGGQFTVPVDENARIRWVADDASRNINGSVIGWTDPRGKE